MEHTPQTADRMAATAPGKFLVLLPLALFCLSGQQEDKTLLSEINLARTSPKTYAGFLRDRIKLYDGKVLRLPGEIPLRTQEGAGAVREAVRHLGKAKPVPALKWSAPLALAALDHARYLGRTGAMSHLGSKGEEPSDRAQRYGSKASLFGENISFGPSVARQVITDLLVDDGVKSRGHRRNMLSPDFTEVGAACGPHKRYGTVCVIAFAAGS